MTAQRTVVTIPKRTTNGRPHFTKSWMVYPPASITIRLFPAPNGDANTPDAQMLTTIAPARGLIPAAWQSIRAIGRTRTVADEFLRNCVLLSLYHI